MSWTRAAPLQQFKSDKCMWHCAKTMRLTKIAPTKIPSKQYGQIVHSPYGRRKNMQNNLCQGCNSKMFGMWDYDNNNGNGNIRQPKTIQIFCSHHLRWADKNRCVCWTKREKVKRVNKQAKKKKVQIFYQVDKKQFSDFFFLFKH